MNSILNRRSIRKYEARQVEEEKLQLLLQAAMSAPTARNQREWEFVVVTEKPLLEALSQASPYTKPAAGAPLVIVPLINETKLTSPSFAEQDLGACCQNILVEAVELGLGAVWMGILPNEERMAAVSEILKLPRHVRPFAILSIGYPAEERDLPERYEATRIHYNRY